MYRCARIQGLDTAEGLFLIGQQHFYVVDGVTLLSTKEIKDIDLLPPEYVGICCCCCVVSLQTNFKYFKIKPRGRMLLIVI